MAGLVFTDLTYRQSVNLENFITAIEVNLTMDLTSQITVKVNDESFFFNNANIFQIRRPVFYAALEFEIASVQLEQGGSFGCTATLECRTSGIQRLKRNKNGEGVSNLATTGTGFAMVCAKLARMGFVGQETTEEYAPIQPNADGTDNNTSVFDVLQSVAGNNQFMVFESNGTLVFASQEWLLGKYGNYVFNFPSGGNDAFQLLQMPTFRSSDDDAMAAEFQAVLRRENATQLRPGMTIFMRGVNNFQTAYLITEVSWDEMAQGSPVSVSGRTPVKIDKKTQNNIG